jgi:hypothetical protein
MLFPLYYLVVLQRFDNISVREKSENVISQWCDAYQAEQMEKPVYHRSYSKPALAVFESGDSTSDKLSKDPG